MNFVLQLKLPKPFWALKCVSVFMDFPKLGNETLTNRSETSSKSKCGTSQISQTTIQISKFVYGLGLISIFGFKSF